MVVLFTEMQIYGEGNQESSFTLVTFEKCFRYPTINVKKAVEYKTLKLGKKLGLETNLEVIG